MVINNYRLIDISPTISFETGVFPGDVKFQRQVSLSFEKKDHLLLSSITTTLHIGAHADAPSHYSQDGEGIHTRELDFYVGSCLVIDKSQLWKQGMRRSRLMREDLQEIPINAKRVLIKTGSFPNPDCWNSDFMGLDPFLIDYLHENGVRTIGIDTPSIDPEDSKDLPAHQTICKHQMAILEGLVLEHVKAGHYFLSAAPLKIKNADAGPVRAFLLES